MNSLNSLKYSLNLGKRLGGRRYLSNITGRAIVYSKYGEPEDELKVQTFTLNSNPQPDQVLVKLLAAPINPADINQVEGVYPSRPALEPILGSPEPIAVGGNEGVFEVVAVGSKLLDHYKVGDWTIPTKPNFGTWRTHAVAAKHELSVISNNSTDSGSSKLSPLQAATVSVNPATAYKMLTEFVKLEPGDWFIQNGGTSAVGRAAVQLAKLWGVNSISVIRDRDDFDTVAAELKQLGATQVISEKQAGDKSFKPTIKSWLDATGDKSIKLALNCVGGASCTNIARHLGKNAHLVTYGGMSKKPVTIPTSLFIFKNLKCHGYWLSEWTKRDPEGKLAVIEEILSLYKKGQFVDAPSQVHKVRESVTDEDFLSTWISAIKGKGQKQIVQYE